MDWQTINSRLASLPSTYRRSGTPFTAWESSLTESLALPNTAIESIMEMLSFGSATGKWLDLWGGILGIPRHSSEVDSAYGQRITATLTAWRGTVPALIRFIQETLDQTIGVIESLPTPGYQISVPVGINDLQQVSADLNFVRPAGVPYGFTANHGGLFLGTVNYVGRSRLSGSYLTTPRLVIPPSIPAATNNSVPIVPTTFLSDPTINS